MSPKLKCVKPWLYIAIIVKTKIDKNKHNFNGLLRLIYDNIIAKTTKSIFFITFMTNLTANGQYIFE